LLVASSIGLPWTHSDEPPRVEIILERVERVSRDEAHFWVKITNRVDRPIFVAGINYESGPRPYPVYLEQWRTKEGWKIVVPCMDTPPPDVIKLNPGEGMTFPMTLVGQRSAICRERTIQLEGRFRFRLEYFDTDKQARTYLDKLFGRTEEEVKPRLALSETFEIPPAANPK
jgi:hypothetical protein